MIEIKEGLEFEKQANLASTNLSNILVPVPSWKVRYNQVQEQILKEIFND